MHRSSSRSKVSPLLAERARGLRERMADSESALWRALSGRKMLGVRFVRQVPLAGRFIADFAAPGVKLVVEVDGGWHQGRERLDARRDRVFARLGWRVLRLDAELVLRNLPEALARIRAALEGV